MGLAERDYMKRQEHKTGRNLFKIFNPFLLCYIGGFVSAVVLSIIFGWIKL